VARVCARCRATAIRYLTVVSPPDGRLLISGSYDHTLKLWDVRSAKCLRTLERHDGGVSACRFSPDSRLLVSGFLDHTLKLWEVHSGKCLRTLEGHGGSVTACGFSPDGCTLTSGSWDGTLKLWEVRTGEMYMTLVNAPDGQSAALDERHNRILALPRLALLRPAG
jgi:WD40 repeat protein